MLRLTLALMVLLPIATACGRGELVSPAAGYSGIDLGCLPERPHAVSMTAIIPGDDTIHQGGDVTSLGGSLRIQGDATQCAWAVFEYGLSENGVPTGLSLNVTNIEGQYWVGLADYGESNAWEWCGPYTGSGSVFPWVNGAKYRSSSGNFHWAVATTTGYVELGSCTVTESLLTYVTCPGVGDIAVRIDEPSTPRYPEGAPIIVAASGWFTPAEGFGYVRAVTDVGAINVSYLWPGNSDLVTGAESSGTDDYAGPDSLAALRDVIRFALGEIPNTDGNYIADIVSVTPLLDNVGIYAFSHPGVAATNVMAYYGDAIADVKYFIGRENPVSDEQYPLELGYWDDDDGSLVTHPYYQYPADYTPTHLSVDYSTVGWLINAEYPNGQPTLTRPDSSVFVFGWKGPKIDDARYYSRGLTAAMAANNVFGAEPWPEDVATPAEVDAFWPYRVCVNGVNSNYDEIGTKLPGLKVMLVFAADDHVQVSLDKPHIHQAWHGFRVAAGLPWVRLNPDGAYVAVYNPVNAGDYVERAAMTEPGDWLAARLWGYPNDKFLAEQVAKASIAEMADRTRAGDWSNNLTAVLP